MPIETVLAAIEAAHDVGMSKVMLIGGEPTCSKAYFAALEAIAGSGMKASVASNGIAFSDDGFCRRSAKSGLASLNISLKGYSRKNYIENTGTDRLSEVLAGYKKAKERISNVMLSYVMQGIDEQEANCLRELLEANEIQSVFLQQIKPDGSKNLTINSDILARTVERFYYAFENSSVRTVFDCSIPLCMIDGRIINKLIDERRLLTTCYIRKGSALVVDADGGILPCNHLVGHPLQKLESWTADSLIALHNSDDALKLRNIINHYPSEKCSTCKMWPICGGGCPLRWLTNNPKEEITEPFADR